ncbi:putative RNA methyltransferase At5g51130 [Chlorella sorokiniana]|uniref:RNA methyltransferase n=1 Tax=Chlorella sorokiniana TaxID=3076 RepID=A0A2P6TWM4_CHLSO|nr:putative RNA methyltransferase At5g51130 [Chlorella sorokiniana]|eukprot:PRW58460.1 putative RNA methyltransferase At5g51130 [Chlorella sorokiniana]
MQRSECPDSKQQQALRSSTGPEATGGLSRKQKRLLRQKRAKLFQRAAVQESSHSEAAEDYALQLAYEQHLRQLQQHHPQQAGAQAPTKQRQQQQQQQQQQAGASKRRRRSGAYTGTGPVGAAAVARPLGSVDTLASSAALAVPAAHPSQKLAQISELSSEGAVPADSGAQQQQQQPQGVAGAATGSPAAPGAVAAASSGSVPHLQDWSAPATLLGAALMRQDEAHLAQQAAAKTAGICRMDLSAAALLIGTQLSPAASPAAATGPVEAAVPGQAPPADAAVGVECGAIEDATEAAAGSQQHAQQQRQEQEQEDEQRGAKRQRRQQQPYVHGNYHRYYGYRYFSSGGSSSASSGGPERGWQFDDPRLAVFERRWFARRRCLDVGCNEGLLTLALATRLGPRSMLGVDIDSGLIGKACRHLSEARTATAQRVRASRRGGVPAEERRAAQQAAAALGQTMFVHTDFLESAVEAGSLDTITCLSVTKWVHLNRGDEGLKALFASFHAALAPGGLLLLEPQPWRSYRKAGDKVRRAAAPPGSFFHRLHELQLRPDGFADYLCTQLGFRLLKQFGVQASASAGFDRPMVLLRKPRPRPAAPAAQQQWQDAECAAEQRWQQDEWHWAAEEQQEEQAAEEQGWREEEEEEEGWQDECGEGEPWEQAGSVTQ